ncbi:RNA polymerase sigma factor [Planctomycetes bacterium Poly30]|uniref:RNA polymerase sigma factor n=1 Tax=Saltatorellus ferox TaxID=2528018 RepID=A0A518EYH6_9BACT|nr:RNA polymerase sigma factor [Planctomycetes bacterium Poly30]
MDATSDTLHPHGHGDRNGPDLDLARSLQDWIWLGHLCARLVADPGLADDARQEAWLAGSSRHSMFLAARRFIWRSRRSERRRSVREEAAARPESLPSTDELVLRSEQQRRVWDQLMALDEPYRTALLLRYQEGLEPKEIADRQDVAADTIRWRLRRGVEKLRECLDADEEGGGLRAVALGVPSSLAPIGVGGGGTVANTTTPTAGASPTAASSTAASSVSAASVTAASVLVMLKLTLALSAMALVAVGWHSALTPPVEPIPPMVDAARAPQPGAEEPLDLMRVFEAREEATGESPRLAGDARDDVDDEALPPPPPEAHVIGRVFGPRGRPMAGARVEVTEADRARNEDSPFQAVVLADASGAFEVSIPLDALGRYHVTASGSDFMSQAKKAIGQAAYEDGLEWIPIRPFNAGDPTDLGAFRLEDACVLTGQVVTEDGSGLVGAEIRPSGAFAPTRVLADGSFRIPHAPPGTGREAHVRASGHLSKTIEYTSDPGATTDLGPITLEGGPTVSGIVFDTNDRPVPGAEVRTLTGTPVITDHLGRFTLAIEHEASVQLYGEKEGVGLGSVRAIAGDEGVLLRLAALAPRANFRIVDRESKQPLLAFGYRTNGRGLMEGQLDMTSEPVPTTRDSATFQARCRPEGDKIRVAAPGYRTTSFGVKESAFTDLQVLELRKGRLVKGQVQSHGSPRPNALVQVLAAPAAGQLRGSRRTVVSDSEGRFEFPVDREAEFTYVAQADGESSRVLTATVERRGDTDLGILVLTAAPTLRGRLECKDGVSRSLEGHEIRIEGLLARSVITDEEGRFSFEGLPEGDVELRLVPSRGASLAGGKRTQTFFVQHAASRPGEIVLSAEFQATEPCRLAVKLNGEPAAGHSLMLWEVSASSSGPRVVLDDAGEGIVEAVPGSAYRVHLGSGSARLELPGTHEFSAYAEPQPLLFEAGSLEVTLPPSFQTAPVMYATLHAERDSPGRKERVTLNRAPVLERPDGRVIARFDLLPTDLDNVIIRVATGEEYVQLRCAIERRLSFTLKPGEALELEL